MVNEERERAIALEHKASVKDPPKASKQNTVLLPLKPAFHIMCSPLPLETLSLLIHFPDPM